MVWFHALIDILKFQKNNDSSVYKYKPKRTIWKIISIFHFFLLDLHLTNLGKEQTSKYMFVSKLYSFFQSKIYCRHSAIYYLKLLILNLFHANSPFYTPWKRQWMRSFLTFTRAYRNGTSKEWNFSSLRQ